MRANHDQHNEPHPRPRAGRAQAFSGRMAVGLLVAGVALLPTAFGGIAGTRTASAAEATVNLGTATPFVVLAGAGVTNTGPTILRGDLGTCPTPAITGFLPGVVVPPGDTHANDEVACLAQDDLTIAYNSAAGRAPTESPYPGATDLGGSTLLTGVYKTPESFAITGTLTLDAQQVPGAVFIFQAGSTLITATNSRVLLVNGAQACNVFWQVGSSATLGVGSTFTGTVMALTSITAKTLATVDGRLLARNGAVTLDSNTVSAGACATGDSSSSSSSSSSTTGSGDGTSSTTATTGSDGSTSSTTATSSSSTSTSSSSSSTTLPLLSGSSSSTTTTQPGSTTTTEQAASTSSTRFDSAIVGAADTSGPATATDVLGGSVDGTDLNGPAPAATLPRTGSPIAAALLLAGLALVLGSAALRFGRARHG